MRMKKKAENRVLSVREPISGEFAGKIIARSNSFYLRLDPRWIKFWDLELGDWIQIRATTVRRLEKPQ